MTLGVAFDCLIMDCCKRQIDGQECGSAEPPGCEVYVVAWNNSLKTGRFIAYAHISINAATL
jgi:hypothetical protein